MPMLLALVLSWGSAGAEEFRFVVMGDNRPGRGVEPPEVFLRIIDEVNLLDPDFVVLCGDLILGGGDLEETLRQWEEYDKAVSRFRMKVWPVAGNHDYWDSMSDSLWRARFGKPVYSFDHKGSHFVVLNTEELGYTDRISPRQLKWLKEDLRKAKDAKHIFVFLHKPIWAFPSQKEGWWRDVHPILAEHRVDAVFAGHWHQYTWYPRRDGVRYIVTGGAGAPLRRGPGGFHHYLFVTVRDEEVRIAVVEPGKISDERCVDQEMTDALNEFLKGVRVEVELPDQGSIRKVVKVGGRNPLEDSLFVEVSWQESGAWEVEPERNELRLGPGERGEMEFVLAGDAARPYPAPSCSLTARSGGRRLYSVSGGIRLYKSRSVVVPRLGGFRIDGKDDEGGWRKAGLAGEFSENVGYRPISPGTEVRLAHDGKFLYIFARLHEPDMGSLKAKVKAHDGPVWKDDCLEVFLQPPGEGYYHIVVNSKGVTYDCWNRPSGAEVSWNPGLKVATSSEEDSWTVEMAVPFSALGRFPSSGEAWKGNFCRERYAGEGGLSCWSCPLGGFHRPDRFGEIRFR